ncbi:hypothetical protein EI427_17940 [Flammeovirga pectinis]|uniref:Tetratricopeptide repeat protein n=1 Tax=Flammeovirga pectinis TaxID=2494373 RepID=A0A3Q9FT49_9BACT|nr:hypothetical protein [Flammeovirga pectinis]AZQ64039.1 hypothetical protein EI427_17940 [Flammeovirga pectinis]
MKTIISSAFISLFILLSSFSPITIEEDSPNSEKVSLLVKMVNDADKQDWKVLNKAAQFCINWNADLELAKEWIDKSIAISDNAQAYEVLGDYHLRKGDIYNAYKNYAIALEKGMFTLSKTELESIQRKNLVFGRKLIEESKK